MSNKEHGWANPLPAGLVALAVVCFMYYALMLGKVNAGKASILIGLWMIGGFVVQVIVGVVELKEGSIAGGNLFTFFSGFFMLTGGMVFIAKVLCAVNGFPIDPAIEAYAWLPIAITLLLWTPAYMYAPAYMFMVILTFDIALPIMVLMNFGFISHTVGSPIIGYLCLFGGSVSLLLAAAIVVNGTLGRKIIPNPGPLFKLPVPQQ